MKKLIKNKTILIIILSVGVLLLGTIWLIYENINNNTDQISISNFNPSENITTDENSEKELNQKTKEEDDEYIYIHIIGEVNNAGIIKIKKGSRIADAINAAEGTTEIADLSKVNLAYILSDGQQVNIPSIYEKEEEFQYISEEAGENVIRSIGIKNGNSKVNINTASQTELETLTGIGPSIASRIVKYREENGRFNSVEELLNVSGIGESKYEEIKNEVVVK